MRLTPIRLVVTLALGILTAPLAAEAQRPAQVPRIGVLLTLYAPAEDPPEAFRQGLRALGYIEGQNIAIEWRSAEGKYDQLPALAAELVRLGVDVIVADVTRATQAARQATSQHSRSAKFWVISSCVCPIVHLLLLMPSQQ